MFIRVLGFVSSFIEGMSIGNEKYQNQQKFTTAPHHYQQVQHTQTMQQKDSISTPPSLGDQLILFDDDFLNFSFSSKGDLYLQLVKEPSFVKQQSIKYDYSPAPVFLVAIQPSPTCYPKNDEIENFSQEVNRAGKDIKCSCSKTKCQKNYCQCFKAGKLCGAECGCLQCSNDQISILTEHKKSSGSGCKCQKSHCTKNYCECHNGGRKCGEDCKCTDCHNVQNSKQSDDSGENLGRKRKRVKKERQTKADVEARFQSRII